MNQPLKNPGVAALLSVFFPGVGQIYNGEVMKGFAFMVAIGFSVLATTILIGFLFLPIVFVLCVSDAYKTAEKYNNQIINDAKKEA
jgi:TM2 domain-containing membrane protein YozV